MNQELEADDDGPGPDGGVTPPDVDQDPETTKELMPWMNRRYAFVMRSQKACIYDVKAAESERSDITRQVSPFIMLSDFMAKFENKRVKHTVDETTTWVKVAPYWRNDGGRQQYESVEFRPDRGGHADRGGARGGPGCRTGTIRPTFL